MNLPLDFNSAEPWTRIVKIALTIAAVYVIAVVGLFGKGNFLGGAVLLVFGLAFSAVLRRARRVSMGAAGRLTASAVTVHPVRVWGVSLNVPSGEFFARSIFSRRLGLQCPELRYRSSRRAVCYSKLIE